MYIARDNKIRNNYKQLKLQPMKKIYIVLSLVLLLLGGLFTGCDNAEYTTLDNNVYLADAGVSLARTKVVTMEPGGATVTVAVRLAKPVDYDVEVRVKIDTSVVEAYNAQYNTTYIPVPAAHIRLPENATVVIKAQEVSGVLHIHIDNFETNNLPYCVPVALDGVKNAGPVQSATLSDFIYLINKPIITSVPHITKNNSCKIEGTWGVSCSVWTMEFWARMGDLTTNNQAILEFNNSDPDFIYLVWGDVRYPRNIFRVKVGNNEVYTDGILELDKWTHYAVVNDGALVTIYINGETSNLAPFGGPQVLATPGGMWGGLKNCDFCQFRIWNTARTHAEIRNNMLTEVNASNPNLIVYWKANEGAGGVLHDATGNGRDMTITKDGVEDTGLTWYHNIRFDRQ
jgi:hypothetical protein